MTARSFAETVMLVAKTSAAALLTALFVAMSMVFVAEPRSSGSLIMISGAVTQSNGPVIVVTESVTARKAAFFTFSELMAWGNAALTAVSEQVTGIHAPAHSVAEPESWGNTSETAGTGKLTAVFVSYIRVFATIFPVFNARSTVFATDFVVNVP